MKKMYIAPEAELLILNLEMPLAASVHTDNGIGYGGVGNDTDDPAAKEDDVQWDW